MRRYLIIIPVIAATAIIILVLTTAQPASARWYWYDCAGIEVLDVCRDGMYFALGYEVGSGCTEPSSHVEIEHFGTSDVLLSFSEDLPGQPVPYPNDSDVNHYKYYVRQWKDGNLLLEPGEKVLEVEGDKLYTVQDCSVLPEEPAATTAFSYQGMLHDDDAPADGLYDLRFSLWNADKGGTAIGDPVIVSDVAVEDGLFTVQLDFGQEAFSGSARWLAMSVRHGDSTGAYTSLTPRQELLSVPYATGLVAGAVISDAVPGPALAVHNPLGNGLEVSGDNYGIVVGSVMTDSLGVLARAPNGVGVTGLSAGGSSDHIPEGFFNGGGEFVGNNGVLGAPLDSNGVGVIGLAPSNSSTGAGVYGVSPSGSNPAGVFAGNVDIYGSLSKSSGSFKIDHPLYPADQYLYHSFVESPDMMNIYNGNVTLDANGDAWVELPDWFQALNQDFRYQLTPVGAPGPNLYIAEGIANNRFKISGGAPRMTVSWQVTGIRHDPYAEANRIPVEEAKPAHERGTFLHPLEHGQPAETGLRFQRLQQLQRSSTEPPISTDE